MTLYQSGVYRHGRVGNTYVRRATVVLTTYMRNVTTVPAIHMCALCVAVLRSAYYAVPTVYKVCIMSWRRA
jgi:hypothetical protein